MNDDPTQLFPETHWKRHATERVSVPSRRSNDGVRGSVVHIEMTVGGSQQTAPATMAKMPTQPLLH